MHMYTYPNIIHIHITTFQLEIQSCTGVPVRTAAVLSDRYLMKAGRLSRKSPSELMQYQRVKALRNEKRKEIVDEIEGRELTFKPRLNLKSQLITVYIDA